MEQPSNIQHIIDEALAEDIGDGDITSTSTIDHDATCTFAFVARNDMTVSGINVAIQVFHTVDDSIKVEALCNDGDIIKAGTSLLKGAGNARNILTAERTALNFMQHMSGISTLTQQYVTLIKHTNAVILDTRKTTPLLRTIEKYAVLQGGGKNHRMRLDDLVLIKDNHISVNGSITNAIERSRANIAPTIKIEVECDTLAQVKEAIAAKADIILLDNMTIDQLKEAVALAKGRIPLEASGNVNLDTVKAIAETGVDYISVGRITHSAPNVDIGLDITFT